jgi:Sigma-70, region 4
MATFDQLSPEQRAIVELILRQGKTYEELADMLKLPEPRVRELARDALVELAPVSVRGVEEDWRGQLADYVLGQQSGPEATATKGHLRRSEAARSWARSLLDSLEQLYENGSVPAIPDGERGRSSRRAAPAAAAAAGEPAAKSDRGEGGGGLIAAGDPVMRRRLMAGAAALVLVLLVVTVWPVGLMTGDDDDDGGSSSAEPASAQNGGDQTPVNAQTRGQAIIAEQSGKPIVLISAVGLQPSPKNTAYQVWLYNSESDRKSLGAQVTDDQGNFGVSQALPADYKNFKFIDMTLSSVKGEQVQTGDSVLRGLLKLRDKPVTRGTGKNKATLLGQVELLPLPNNAG